MKKQVVASILFFYFLYFPLFSNADTIYFTDGTRLDVKKVWEENGQVKCEMYGSIVGYPKESVKRIEKNLYKKGKEAFIPINEEKGKTMTFKDKFLKPLKWGMSVDLFKSSYPRSDELIKSPSQSYKESYYKDLSLPFHGHTSITGFRFGEKGLDNIIISFEFRDKGRHFNQGDVLGKSKRIYEQLKQSYGKPKRSFPWDGNAFNHIWVINETLLMFAWNGDDNWGVQFRSVELDPMARNMVNQIKGN